MPADAADGLTAPFTTGDLAFENVGLGDGECRAPSSSESDSEDSSDEDAEDESGITMLDLGTSGVALRGGGAGFEAAADSADPFFDPLR